MALETFYFAVLAVLCGSGAFPTTVVFAAMQVVETITLCYKGGPHVPLPTSLIHQDPDGTKWLKFRPSSHIITRLVLGHLDDFKKAKNPSLAQSPKVKELHLKVKEALQGFEEEPAGEMFEGDSKGEGKGNKKKDKVSLQHAPQSVFITLMESQIEVKTPTSWKQSDVLVPIDATTLTNLCDYILEDVSCCLQKEGKRAYQQSGKFAKRPKEAE